jgi:hypothetical protein
MTRTGFVWLFLSVAMLVAEMPAPVEAQRASVSGRARRARMARLRRARARRARQAQNAVAIDVNQPADMDFTAHYDEERPPAEVGEPWAAEQPAEPTAEELQTRRDNLDPELFGEDAPAERARYSPLTARIAARAFHRGLSYRDYESGAVANYDLPLGAAALVAVDYYPLAHVLNDGWAHLGFSWGFAHSIGVESIGPNNIGYPTNAYQWQIGLRYRVPLDDAGGEIGFEAGYGEQGFHVERGNLENPSPEGVPAVDYDLFRVGVAGRFTIGEAAIGGRLAYLPVIASGAIASPEFFGGADTHGFEVGVDFTYHLGLGFEVLAEIDLRLFSLSFPAAGTGDASAAGAFDRYLGANVGLRWRMPAHAQL